jgi:hypothetical protein
VADAVIPQIVGGLSVACSATISVAVPSITDPDIAKVDVDVSAMDFQPTVGDAVIVVPARGPADELPPTRRVGERNGSGADHVRFRRRQRRRCVEELQVPRHRLHALNESVEDLAGFVASLTYKPGWVFKVGGPRRRFLCVFATTTDASDRSRQRTTQHMFEHPPLPAPTRELARWVFDCLLLCEQHECGEFFQVGDVRPFFPNHAEGSPYELVERWE